MLDIPAFTYSQGESYYKTTPAPFLCWDIASPALEKSIYIHNDIVQLESLAHTHDWQLDIDYKSSLIDNYTIVVTNLSKEIIWVSRTFQSMTGYCIDEAIGRKPSFLQGEKTNLRTRQFINDKLANFESLKTRILNFRKNGESYWCGIKIFPVRNSLSVVTHYIAIEKEVN